MVLIASVPGHCLNKNHKFLEFSKSQSQTSKIRHISYENISAVQCTNEREQKTKLDKVPISQIANFRGAGVFGFFTSAKTVFRKR